MSRKDKAWNMLCKDYPEYANKHDKELFMRGWQSAMCHQMLSDGFGNSWSRWCDCGAELEIVRPGKVQCSVNCEER